MDDTDPKQAPELDVVLRRLEHDQTDGRYAVGVFCPRKQRPVDVRACRGCEHCHGLRIDPAGRETFLRCDAVGAEPETTRDEKRSVVPQEASLASIMSRVPMCVDAQTKITMLIELFLHHGVSAVPVIDADGLAIAVVSNTDLDLESGVPTMTVGDVMSDGVYTLGVDAAISRAAGLMAYERVHRIVVTDAAGVPVGVVSSLDVLGWLARCDGYVIPELTRSSVDP
jgi:CBS domain-containing protein